MVPFTTNTPKDTIRREFDKGLVAKTYLIKGIPLTYFGLPGAEMLDVMEWKDYIGRVVAVEREEISRHLMRTRAFHAGFSSADFQILCGDINAVLSKRVDENGTEPLVAAFDIVNLDYVSGILHKDLRGRSRVVTAMRRLFEFQSNESHGFLLLLTFNSRTSDAGEFDRVLNGIKKELLKYRIKAKKAIDWYTRSRIDYKIKVYVPYVFANWCRTYGFTCESMNVITYKGTGKARMIHFGIDLSCQSENVAGALETQALTEILNVPMYEVHEGKVRLAEDQAPEVTV